jgi:hypothetical protein
MEVSSSFHAPTALLPEKAPGAHWIGWVGLRASDAVWKKKAFLDWESSHYTVTIPTELSGLIDYQTHSLSFR